MLFDIVRQTIAEIQWTYGFLHCFLAVDCSAGTVSTLQYIILFSAI